MKKHYVFFFIICLSHSIITQTNQLDIMLMSNTSNDKNKCYITAKHNNVLVGTLTASLDNDNKCVYHIKIEPEYEKTAVTYFLINAMKKEFLNELRGIKEYG